MKPLTIEELKALKRHDWIWIVENGHGIYKIFLSNIGSDIWVGSPCAEAKTYSYEDYGTKWVAYKNKEQAEAKGEIVELPCKVGDTVYYTVYNRIADIYELAEEKLTEIMIRENGIYGRTIHTTGLINDGRYMFTDKAEAERRLAELKGE